MTPSPQRRFYQTWQHLDKVRDAAFEMRDEAKAKNLDGNQDLTEIIFNVSQAQARLRHLCRRRFAKAPEDLAVYQ